MNQARNSAHTSYIQKAHTSELRTAQHNGAEPKDEYGYSQSADEPGVARSRDSVSRKKSDCDKKDCEQDEAADGEHGCAVRLHKFFILIHANAFFRFHLMLTIVAKILELILERTRILTPTF